MTRIFCGVDVSARTLDASIGRDGAVQRFARTAEGIDHLIAFCRHHQVSLLVMEATGGYERLPAGRLWAAEMAVAIVNPRAVRDFAKATGQLEKTDRIDCGLIAWYAETKRVQPTPPASQTQARLTAMVVRHRQLTASRTQQTNQRQLVTDATTLDSFEPVLAAVTSQLRRLEEQITAVIAADPLWQALDAAFRTIKGVADRTIARLMAELPEIGTLSNKAVAKLAGWHPWPTTAASTPDDAFHQKLCEAAKPRKVIRVALARKLLVRLNAKARDIRQSVTISA